MAMAAQGPRPRTSSRCFSLITLQRECGGKCNKIPTRKPARGAPPGISIRAVCGSRKNTARQRADQKCDARTDEHVPGEGDVRKSENEHNGGKPAEHTDERAGGVCTSVEGAQEKKTKQTAKGKRRNGEAGFEEMAPGKKGKGNKYCPPDKGGGARELQEGT